MPLSESVTQMLIEWNAGDESALERLTPFVYDELRRRAASYLRREQDAETLQATALVHEAYLQILDLRNIKWQNRAHFINTIAMLMRRILVDHAREHKALKRSNGKIKVSISRAELEKFQTDIDLVSLDEVLERFAKEFPRQANIVQLKFFGGLTIDEIADLMIGNGEKISASTIERDWRFARAWLHNELAIAD